MINQSNNKINALVIGAGTYGKNYIKALSDLSSKKYNNFPIIDKIIFSQTSITNANNSLNFFKNNNKSWVNLVPVEIKCPAEASAYIMRFKPNFIAVTAKDKFLGHDIHALYVEECLKYTSVLCEKPFLSANGDGSSLKRMHNLFDYNNSHRFGLNLPFAYIIKELLKNSQFKNIYNNANNIKFYWNSTNSKNDQLVNDLALHPWSMIKDFYDVKSIKYSKNNGTISLLILLQSKFRAKPIACEIYLSNRNNFRGFSIDKKFFTFIFKNCTLKLCDLSEKTFFNLFENYNDNFNCNTLISIVNPLRKIIYQSIINTPYTNLRKAYKSQVFLESILSSKLSKKHF